jgi:hypothetical protein
MKNNQDDIKTRRRSNALVWTPVRTSQKNQRTPEKLNEQGIDAHQL